MGLGGTAKKIQKLGDVAEKLYAQVGDLREKVSELHERVETTTERLENVEAESRRQRALIEAMAREQGIDVDAVLADVEAELEAEADENGDSDAESGPSGAAEDGQSGQSEDGQSDEPGAADDRPAETSAGHEKD